MSGRAMGMNIDVKPLNMEAKYTKYAITAQEVGHKLDGNSFHRNGHLFQS